jgi:hypothetical protein
MTSYFCWKCKTKDHWADEVCPRAEGGKELQQTPVGSEKGFDRTKYQREYMRKYRARKSTG